MLRLMPIKRQASGIRPVQRSAQLFEARARHGAPIPRLFRIGAGLTAFLPREKARKPALMIYKLS